MKAPRFYFVKSKLVYDCKKTMKQLMQFKDLFGKTETGFKTLAGIFLYKNKVLNILFDQPALEKQTIQQSGWNFEICRKYTNTLPKLDKVKMRLLVLVVTGHCMVGNMKSYFCRIWKIDMKQNET